MCIIHVFPFDDGDDDDINALARASDLKTTPPTDKEPPLADKKRRGK